MANHWSQTMTLVIQQSNRSPCLKSIKNRSFKPNHWLLISLLSLIFACDDQEQGEVLSLQAGDDGVIEVSGGSVSDETMIIDGMGLGEMINPNVIGFTIAADSVGLAEELLMMTTQAIKVASVESGSAQIVTSGTITQVGQSFTYQAMPNDRLVVQYSNGIIFNLFIEQIQGSFDSVDQFFDQNHILSVRAQSEDRLNLIISSEKSDQGAQASLRGDVIIEQIGYQLNLLRETSYNDDVDAASAERETEEHLTGTITSLNLDAQINESTRYKLVIFDHAIENITRTINNTWVNNSAQYTLQQVKLRYETLDGWANPSDYWIAEGNLIKNGQMIGQVNLDQQPLWIDVFLQLNDGTRYEIQRHLLQSEN
jgi:hypothetical protein